MEKEGYDAQVRINALTKSVPQYEEKERIIKGSWFKKDTVEKYREVKGSKTETRSMKDFGKENPSQAFLVSFNQLLNEGPGHFSFDGRPGKTFDVFVAVPQAEAQALKEAIQNDPTIVRDVISKFNPELMTYIQEHGGLPDAKKIFFAPQG